MLYDNSGVRLRILLKTVIANRRREFHLKIKLPCFDPEMISGSGQIFRMYREEDGSFTVYSSDKILGIAYTEEKYVFELSCSEKEFEEYWKHYLDCETDYDAICAGVDESDPFLKAAVDFSHDIRVLNQDLFEMIISFIISQQKRIPDIRRCIEALCEKFGRKRDFSEKKDTARFRKPFPARNCFPEPQAIAAAGREGVSGMSLGYREPYVYEAAVRFLRDDVINSGQIYTMTFEDAKKHLKTYLGIGEKVANCICLFALGHKNAFPVDVHIKEILKREYNMETASEFNEVYSEFVPFRGIVQQWIFAYEINRKK